MHESVDVPLRERSRLPGKTLVPQARAIKFLRLRQNRRCMRRPFGHCAMAALADIAASTVQARREINENHKEDS